MSKRTKKTSSQSSEGSNLTLLSESKIIDKGPSREDLMMLSSALKLQIGDLAKEIEEKNNKIRQLEHMIQKMVPKLGEEAERVMMVTDEEIIVLEQIERLKYIGKQRQMTPDEVKMLDTLIKNKRLLQGKSTTINAEYEKIKDLGTEDLLALASKK